MYPEDVWPSRSNDDELTILFGKPRNAMQSSRAVEVTDSCCDLIVKLQYEEVLDLSTKRPTPHALHSDPSNTSPAPPHLKKRRVLWSSELGTSWNSPNHCSVDGTHPPSLTDSADGINRVNTRNAAQRHLLDSFSVCSGVESCELRSETNDLGLTQQRISPLDYPSLVVTVPPPGAIASSVTQPTPDIPLVLARHSLNTTAAAAPATAVVGVDSYLRGIPANCPVATKDSSLQEPPNVPLPVGEYATVAFVPYASPSSSSSSSSYFQGSLRGLRLNAPRADRPSEASRRSPRPSIQSNDSRKRRTGDYDESTVPSRRGSRLEEVRDAGYLERRRKNNESAKRSRDARRQKEEEMSFRAAELEQENLSLKAELLLLRRESAELHHLLYAITDRPQR